MDRSTAIAAVIGVALTVISSLLAMLGKVLPNYLAAAGVTAGLLVIGLCLLTDPYRPPLLSCACYSAALFILVAGAGYQITSNHDPLDGTVDLSCTSRHMPAGVPADESYNLVPLFFDGRDIQTAIVFRDFDRAAGSQLNYPNWMTPTAVVCKVTNYGSQPLYGVKLPVRILVRKPRLFADGRPGIDTGPIAWEGAKEITIAKLDTGANRDYTFYLQALTEIVEITFEPRITGRPLDGTVERSFSLVAADADAIRTVRVEPSINDWMRDMRREPISPGPNPSHS